MFLNSFISFFFAYTYYLRFSEYIRYSNIL